MTGFERDMLTDQIRLLCERDSLWCQPCGMSGARHVLATTRILISAEGFKSMSIDLCPDCARYRFANLLPNDVGSEPIDQPAWTTIARRLFGESETP